MKKSIFDGRNPDSTTKHQEAVPPVTGSAALTAKRAWKAPKLEEVDYSKTEASTNIGGTDAVIFSDHGGKVEYNHQGFIAVFT